MPEILVSYRGEADCRIAAVTISNPTELNALTTEMQLALPKVLKALGEDPSVRGILLRGAGEKAFSSGGAMECLAEIHTQADAELMYRRGVAMRESILEDPKPVVAAVSGWCVGGGFEIALACDLIYAGENARFALTEVNNGLVPGWGGAIQLAQRANLLRAKELLLLGRKISAREALELGVVNRVFPDETLFQEADAVLDTLAAKPPLAVQGIKRVLRLQDKDGGSQAAWELSHQLCTRLMESEDFREAVSAFRQKRKPHFQGK